MKRFFVYMVALLSVFILNGCILKSSGSIDTYTIGGTVSGLRSGTVVLQNNGGDDLSISKEGEFTFSMPLPIGANYAVTVLTQPRGAKCSVEQGSGVITDDNISDVLVVCEAISTYTVGGSVSGLEGTVVLQNSLGNELSVKDDTFAFPAQNDGTAYTVSIKTQPATQTCTVAHGSGTLSGANVSNVVVSCTTNVSSTYSIGGSAQGLNGTLILQNNSGDDLEIYSDSTFVFATKLINNATYNVTVKTAPTGQECSITDGSGSVSGTDITNVYVSCQNSSTAEYHLGGAMSGLADNDTLEVDVQIFGNSHAKSITTNGDFDLGAYSEGSSYDIRIEKYPKMQRCDISPATGTIDADSSSSVTVTCSDNPYKLQVRILDLNDTIDLSATRDHSENNSDRIRVTGDGTLASKTVSLLTGMGDGDVYHIYLYHSGIAKQNCIISTPSGTINGDTVVDIQCQDFDSASEPLKVTYTGVSSLTIGNKDGFSFNYDLDCEGDGTYEYTGKQNVTTCDYSASPGTHTVWIKGVFPAFAIDPNWEDDFSMDNNITIQAWGNQQWLSLEEALNAIYGNIIIAAIDMPDLNNTSSMAGMFTGKLHDSGGKMNTWDTSKVTNMSGLFGYTKVDSTIDISSWQIDSVTNMDRMFACSNFNPDITGWDISGVKSMSWMFRMATSFDQDISGWIPSSVTDMTHMLDATDGSDEMCYSYIENEQMIFNHDLDGWSVGNVTAHEHFKYDGATFAEPIWNP